jgi:hypothetical protein
MLQKLFWAAGIVVCFSLVSAAAQEKGKPLKLPQGQSPRLFFVTKIEKDQFDVSEVLPPKGELRWRRTFHPKFDKVKALDTKQQKLSPAQLRDRIKLGAVVLVAVDEHPIDPAYLKAIAPDTIVLEEIVVRDEAGPGAKSQPKPDK